MKLKTLFYLGILLVLSNNVLYSKQITPKTSVFTKDDAPHWIYVLKDKSQNVNEVFLMNNGILKISGKSTGYLRTSKIYDNFRLKLQWRWTKMLANSGVLIDIQPNDSVWPICYQVQLKANAAGDIICMNGLTAKECTDKVNSTVSKMSQSNEKPLGEWNTMEIISKNSTIRVFVNGKLQNYITGLTVKKGYIGFQNEGKPVEFKGLILKKL